MRRRTFARCDEPSVARYESHVCPASGMYGQVPPAVVILVQPRASRRSTRWLATADGPRCVRRSVVRCDWTNCSMAERVGFAVAADDHVEIVRAGIAGRQHVETGEIGRAGRQPERRHGNQLRPGVDGEHPQLRRSPQVRPPRVQPLPREEGRRGCARAQQRAPFGPERGKRPRGIDEGTPDVATQLRRVGPDGVFVLRHAGGHHAALHVGRVRSDPPSVSWACRATCVMWRGDRSW
jgi:hypothetical protein